MGMTVWEQMDLVEKRCDEYLEALRTGKVAPEFEGSTLRDFQERILILLGPVTIKELISSWRTANPGPLQDATS